MAPKGKDGGQDGVPRIHFVRAFADNYIWIIEYAAGRVAVVDPGDAAPVLRAAAAHGWAITHVLNTHWHGDHVGGNRALKEETGCMIIGPAGEAQPIPGLDRGVGEGDSVVLGDSPGDSGAALAARVLAIGAHTRGHIAFYFAAMAALFPGDTLFAMGCGRLFEGTADDLFQALQKLGALPAATLVYPGHEYALANARFAMTVEPANEDMRARFDAVQQRTAKGMANAPFRLGDEWKTNPFLRARTAAELGDRRRRKDAF